MAELENKAGLIERKRQGLGNPNLIYVKNFLDSGLSGKGHFLKCQNDTSGRFQTTSVEMSKAHGSNTESNDLNLSDPNPFFPALQPEDDEMQKRRQYRDYFLEQLDYDLLLQDSHYDHTEPEEILELLIDACCPPDNAPFLCMGRITDAVLNTRLWTIVFVA